MLRNAQEIGGWSHVNFLRSQWVKTNCGRWRRTLQITDNLRENSRLSIKKKIEEELNDSFDLW